MSEFTTSELFRQAKEQLDIRTCAEHYGLTPDRHGKALCPFHNDHHPSMSFKGQYFKCFSCGEVGDVFRLVGQLTGINKPVDVLKLLNNDFSLGLPLDTKLSPREKRELAEKAREREHYAELEKKFSDWSDKALIALNRYYKLLRQWRTEYAPESPDEEIHPLFTESLQKLSEIDYVTEQLISADRNAMQKFYLIYGKEADRIEQRIKEFS